MTATDTRPVDVPEDDWRGRIRDEQNDDLPIDESERKYHWPLGRRPDDHPSLSELGL